MVSLHISYRQHAVGSRPFVLVSRSFGVVAADDGDRILGDAPQGDAQALGLAIDSCCDPDCLRVLGLGFVRRGAGSDRKSSSHAFVLGEIVCVDALPARNAVLMASQSDHPSGLC
jgi:hypothetical protein